ncbi:MAG: Asp23/Gls24 family envelope stress response protein [Acidimicrobiia bacterium]
MSDTQSKPTTDEQQPTGQRTSTRGAGTQPAVRSPGAQQRAQLETDHGRTSIADTVVAKVAGIACREVPGVHDMGVSVSRAFGALKERMPVGGSEPSPTQGVHVEVGERQAAVDLDIVVEYGASIVDVAQSIRQNVIGRIEGMTGLEVPEVNVSVDDVYLGESEPEAEPRVQ